MATRSYIGMSLPDKSIRYAYCHFDGYPTGVGSTLTKYYGSELMVKALLDHGNMSCLAPDIGLKNDFHNPDGRFCVFYGRDRGEEGQSASICEDELAYLDNDEVPYHYLFEDGKWHCFESGKEIDLTEALKENQ